MTRRIATKKTRKALAAVTTTASGIVSYRTRMPLPEARAVSFAKAVAANGKFLDATVTRSRKANHFHVCFIPNSNQALEKMLNREDAKDVKAMERDGRFFVYTESRYRAGVFQCIGITDTYETSLNGSGSCTCKHFQFRRANSGGECKHIKELRRRQESGIL